MTLTEHDYRNLTVMAYQRAIQWKRDKGDEFAARQLEKGLREVEAEWVRRDAEDAA